MTNKVKGTVKWFNDKKGIGFIESDEGDLFVHYSNIVKVADEFATLEAGEVVKFDIEQSPKGLIGKNIERV